MAPSHPSDAALGLTFTSKIHHDPTPSILPENLPLPKPFAVVITGASRGIGRAIALAFAQAGATGIALAARSKEHLETLAEEIKTHNSAAEVLIFPGDITSTEFVESLAKDVESRFSRLDCLVNNAGYLAPPSSIISSDPVEYWRTHEVNLKAPYLTAHFLLPLMLRSPNSTRTIVNVVSWGVVYASRDTCAAYYASKTGLMRFTELLDREYRKEGVVCVGVHPGAVKTDMTKELGDEFAQKCSCLPCT